MKVERLDSKFLEFEIGNWKLFIYSKQFDRESPMDKKINSPFKKYNECIKIEVDCTGPIFDESHGKLCDWILASINMKDTGKHVIHSFRLSEQISTELFITAEFTHYVSNVIAGMLSNINGYEGAFEFNAFRCHSEEHMGRMESHFTKTINQKKSN